MHLKKKDWLKFAMSFQSHLCFLKWKLAQPFISEDSHSAQEQF